MCALPRLSGVRLLLVEDAARLRQVVRSMLESEGATVFEAGTGREALALVQTQSFDLVLTDLGLPDMPGADVISSIRAVTQGGTPVAVLSGAAPDDLARALRVGADRVFAKPFAWNELVRYLTRRAGSGPGGPRCASMENVMNVLIPEGNGGPAASERR